MASHMQLRLTTSTGTLETTDAEADVLEHILKVMLHAE